MDKHERAGAVCSVCNAPLNAGGSCPACLLRGGLPEEGVAEGPSATVYGDFEIARREDGSLWELGRGGMGVTYKAIDRVLHRQVALKVIQFGAAAAKDHRAPEALRERFLREARAAAALRHANVAGVFHFGVSGEAGRCYYAMELVEGETLEARVRRDGPLDVDTALEVVRQAATALVAAASRGLIHRDLKPGNLMLSRAEGSPAGFEVKVIDFGLAKAAAGLGDTDLTHGGFVGTPAYASPEQFAQQPVDARSDLYSLGVTLWYALSGRAPFAGQNLDDPSRLPARLHLPVEQLAARGVPAPVVALLRRVLALDPAQRPGSARELAGALGACRRQLGAGTAPFADWHRLRAAAAVVLVLALAGGAWWAWSPAARDHVPAIPDKSIAVLPFENLSDDQSNAYFAEGIQDEILTKLAGIADLKVVSRTSSVKYQSKPDDVKTVAQQLGVAHVVEGSVQRAADVVRVNVQLIDARTGAHLWARSYDRAASDVFAVESEVSEGIADALQAKLSVCDRA